MTSLLTDINSSRKRKKASLCSDSGAAIDYRDEDSLKFDIRQAFKLQRNLCYTTKCAGDRQKSTIWGNFVSQIKCPGQSLRVHPYYRFCSEHTAAEDCYSVFLPVFKVKVLAIESESSKIKS